MARLRLMPQSITAQITSLIGISVVFGVALLVAIIWLLFDPPARSDSPTYVAGRISEITRLVRAAKTSSEADALLTAIRRSGLEVKRVALSDLAPAVTDKFSTRVMMRPLTMQPNIELLYNLRDPSGPPSQIIIRLDEGSALMFNLATASLWTLLLKPTALLMIIVMVSMLLLAIYAVRWVVAPLAEVATAAASFGRTPQAYEALRRRGPREIIQVTDALNDMRTRLRLLLDDRTRMIAAISHDLRTPLTRLRLRAERINQEGLRVSILDDLIKVSRLLDETLEYLRDHTRSEPVVRVDLPSFLQTICSDFTDTGRAVSYVGPARLSYECRPRALSRAITNIVENAVKHGSKVIVTLSATAAGFIEIEVSDDGPGIPVALYNQVFEPFFKADDARREDNSGFGLGLSIARDIVNQHGGTIEMHPAKPAGLRVLTMLPSENTAA